MDRRNALMLAPLALTLTTALAAAPADFRQETIVALERGALDRWGKGDPQGYIELYAPGISYFDPMQKGRVDGSQAMRDLLVPVTGKIHIDNYEMVAPKVQQGGDMAVLSYNLISHGKRPDGGPLTVRWNSTVVYQRIEGKWRIIHSHWSFIQPELKTPLDQ